MKRAALLLAAYIATATAPAYAAGELDRAIEPTRPTVRTEIYRGKEAASDCGIGGTTRRNIRPNCASTTPRFARQRALSARMRFR